MPDILGDMSSATPGLWGKARITLEMIKWEHSIFALPFALCGAMLAARGWPHPMQILWIVLCMITARSAAMAFNRLVDARFDAANPRTATRAIPAGLLSVGFVRLFVVVSSALFVLCYILLGGLSSAIYNEVMQFFVICAGLVPVVIVALKEAGGIGGLFAKLSTNGHDFTSAWSGVGLGGHNPVGDWISLVFGLSFCLSFGYWTTNFAEVQRAMSAKNDNSARLTPIIGAYPKAIIPFGIVIPGMAAVLLIPGLGQGGGLPFNDAIPALMNKYLPTGVLGVALTGLLAAFMAGMAANVSSFNAVWTYDIWQDYIRPGRPDSYYLRIGRITTVSGVFIGILTAFIAAGYNNIANYLQTLFSFFNVPIFLAFIVGMVWRKVGRGAGFWGMIVGTLTSFGTWLLYKQGVLSFRSDLAETQWGAIVGFGAGLVAMAIATIFSPPKPISQLNGLVLGLQRQDVETTAPVPWYKSPVVLGIGVLALCGLLYAYIAVV